MVFTELWKTPNAIPSVTLFDAVSLVHSNPSTSLHGSWGWVAQLAVLLFTLIFGAVLGAWVTVYLARPNLKMTGGGGGGGAGPGYTTNYVSIYNSPGLMGVRLGESVIFGKRIHDRLEKGLTVNRNSADECSASIRDKKTGDYILPLWWRSKEDPPRVVRTVSVRSGGSIDLMLFARLNTEPSKYFIYDSASGDFSDVVVPTDENKFRDTKQFVIRIDYSYDHQRLQFIATVRKGYDGRLQYSTEGSGGSF